MSWQLVRQVFETSKAKPMARLVLLNLAERATSDGLTAWPSRETIARECGLSLRGTHELLRYLRKLGEIDFPDSNKGGNNRSNRYRINLPNPAPDAPLTEPSTLHGTALNPAPDAPEPEEPDRVTPLKSPLSKSPGRLRASREDFGW